MSGEMSEWRDKTLRRRDQFSARRRDDLGCAEYRQARRLAAGHPPLDALAPPDVDSAAHGAGEHLGAPDSRRRGGERG